MSKQQPKPVIISEFENKESGMKSFVSIHKLGFCVSLKDMDSGKMLSTHVIYPNEDRAIAEAKKVLI